MSKVTITSRPNRIVIASKGVQGPPGPKGTVTPELEAARDAAIQAATDAAGSEDNAQGAANAASDSAGAASLSADAANASATAAGGAAGNAATAATTATTAAGDASAAATASEGAATAASVSATAASASEAAAAASATTAGNGASAASASASAAAASASHAGTASSQAQAAALQAVTVLSGEYGVLVSRGAGIAAGGYPASRAVRYAVTLNRFYAETVGGPAIVEVLVNGLLAHGPALVDGALNQPVSIPLQPGDQVTFNLGESSATRVWAQIDGVTE